MLKHLALKTIGTNQTREESFIENQQDNSGTRKVADS